MNNKILARVVAAVMAVMMLGTVSFAASLSGNALTTDVPAGYEDDNNATKTVMAFFADSADATEPASNDAIIVLDQYTGATETSFTIDAAKQGENTHVIVLYGGDNSATAKRAVIALATEPTSGEKDVTVTVKNSIVIDDKEYTDVLLITGAFTPVEGETVSEYGFNFTNNEGKSLNMAGTTYVAGTGAFKYSAIMFGVAENYITSNTGYYKYTVAN